MTATYNANDQLASETYDAAGHTLASGGLTFGYDSQHRLTSVGGTAAGPIAYAYNGDGERVARTAGGVTTQYLVDELNPTGWPQVVEEVVGAGVVRVYSYGRQRLSVSQVAGMSGTVLANTHWYGYDGGGHVRWLADASGTVTDRYDYDAAGNLLASSGTTPNPYRYRGEWWDSDTSLYYLRARWYNLATGRFLTRDPLDTGNKYLYGNADPVNQQDPSGMLVASRAAVTSQQATAVYSTTMFIEVPTSSVGGAIGVGVGVFTLAGADFVCILKTATDMALSASELYDRYFDVQSAAFSKGCRAPRPTTVAVPVPVPGSRPLPRTRPVTRTPDEKNDRKKCDPSIPSNRIQEVQASRLPTIALHIKVAQEWAELFGVDWYNLTYLGPNDPFTEWQRRSSCAGWTGPFTCDEYPYANTLENDGLASTWPVLIGEQRRQGGINSRFFQRNHMVQGDRFCVVVVP